MTVSYNPKLRFQVYDILKCFIITSNQLYRDKNCFSEEKKQISLKKIVFIWIRNVWKIKQYIAVKDYLFFS